MIFFTIIVPTYNSEKTISATINSIINQTFDSFEILILDGLSTDNSVEIIKKTNDQRIKLISEKDKGIYDAMNKGIKIAIGDWFYFLGSDDTLNDNTVLEDVYKLISTYEAINTKNMLFYGDVKIVGDTEWAWGALGSIYGGQFDLNRMLTRNICHQAIFYKRTLVSKVGFYNTSYPLCADWDYNLRCWKETEPMYINRVIAEFHSGGASSSTVDDNFQNNFLDTIMNYFNLSPFDPILNDPSKPFIWQVMKKQKEKSFLRYIVNRTKLYFH